MNQTYWVFEFIKVLLAYGFTMFIWPSVVFRPHLSGKSRAYKFCFCVNMSIILINTGVFLMWAVHLLKIAVVAVVFFGIFIVQLFRNYHLSFAFLKDFKLLSNKTITFKRMILRWHSSNSKRFRVAMSKWWASTKGNRIEYSVLIALIVFAIMYFSANALQVHSYGFGDQYVHHSWVYGLEQGQIFSGDIYPEAMHCFIYLACGVFGIKYYSGILFFAGVHIMVYVVSVYLLGKVIFRWRMTSLIAIAGFLTIEQIVINGVFGISRLSWTLPQEFALYSVFMTAYALIGFLRKSEKTKKEKFRFFKLSSWKRYFSDRYLFIFITSIASSITVHFYATIITLFVCLVIAFVYLRDVFRIKKLLKLISAVFIALVIALTPMVGAFISGIPLQGSLFWAISVTKGTEEQYISNHTLDAEETETETEAEEEELEGKPAADAPLTERVKWKIKLILHKTYFELYPGTRGYILLFTNIAVGGISLAGLVISFIIKFIQRLKKKPRSKPVFSNLLKGYLIVAISVFVLLIAYQPKSTVGLPPLVAGTRICSTIDMFTMLLYAIVFDTLLSLIKPLLKEKILKPLSAALCAGIYIFAQSTGLFHGFPYYELTRYPIAVELTNEIVDKMPKYMYTIISTTDELYQVRETGYHEEWIDFLENYTKKTYTIPTPYLFFFIEKKPIYYAHSNFASGPSWLAAEKYPELYKDVGGAQYPYILHGEISEEAAEEKIEYGKKRSETASDPQNRIVLESKAYEWYKKFSELHPNEGKVIYEDDDFLCYCVYQNEFSLFSMGIM